ncbi:hypothetical protein [Neolewinella antarctica]|uniref:Uncharacterized protein n=1 Tax=Neolewinella antarctica TaxID=442734 RepID=A0ABX0XG83_9BACT|nr:hypothetical protein [Neolewinella antarctica]NJC27884.1 hypothetical protein [Neolewinella antarctica]
MRLSLSAFLLLVGLLQSCQDDNLIPTPSETPVTSGATTELTFKGVPLSIVDGTIHVSNEKVLKTLLIEVSAQPVEAKDFFRTIPGYTPAEAAYDKLMLDETITLEEVSSKYDHVLAIERIDGESYVVREIDDEGVSLVMNEYGRVVAGEYVYDFSGSTDGKLLRQHFDLKNLSFRAAEHPDFEVIEVDRRLAKANIVSCRDTDGNRRVLGQLEESRVFINNANHGLKHVEASFPSFRNATS